MNLPPIPAARHAPHEGDAPLLSITSTDVKAAAQSQTSRRSRSSSPQDGLQECDICLLPYDHDRKPSPCTHCKKSFCRTCWQTWSATQPVLNGNRAITCPNCREEVPSHDTRTTQRFSRPPMHNSRGSRDSSARARQRLVRRHPSVNSITPRYQSSMWSNGSFLPPPTPYYPSYNSPWHLATPRHAPPSIGPHGLTAPALPVSHYATYHGPTPLSSHPPIYQGAVPYYGMAQPMYMTPQPPSFRGSTASQPLSYPGFAAAASEDQATSAYAHRQPQAQRWQPGPSHPCPAMHNNFRPASRLRGGSMTHRSPDEAMPPANSFPHHLPPRPQFPASENGVLLPPLPGMFTAQHSFAASPSQFGMPPLGTPAGLSRSTIDVSMTSAQPDTYHTPYLGPSAAWQAFASRGERSSDIPVMYSRPTTYADHQHMQPTFTP